MREHDLLVSLRTIRRPARPGDEDVQDGYVYSLAADVTAFSVETNQYDYKTTERLAEPGWRQYIGPFESFFMKKMVRVALPDFIQVGDYMISNRDYCHGPYVVTEGRLGKPVAIYCRRPAFGTDKEAVIDASIQSGIVALVPRKDGKREEVELSIVTISEMYKSGVPENWELKILDTRFPNLKKARLRSCFTQKRLAEVSGVDVRYIQNVESGASKAGNMTAKNLLALAHALHVDPDWLIS